MTNRFLERYASWEMPQDKPVTLRTCIRINTLKIQKEALIKRLTKKGITLTKVPFLKNGYFCDAPFSLVSMQEYLQGFFYMQEAASQLPVDLLQPDKSDVVVDACAAPGSKTTQIAAYMENSGKIIAMDSDKFRIQALQNNIERLGCKNIIIIHKDIQFIEDLPIKADKILLDAPCSGNYCIDKQWFTKRTLSDIASKASTQKLLLESCWHVLKKGGTLCYSTCSLEMEENEEVIEWALENLEGVSIQPIEVKNVGQPGLTKHTKGCLRLNPVVDQTQGFFIAILQKL